METAAWGAIESLDVLLHGDADQPAEHRPAPIPISGLFQPSPSLYATGAAGSSIRIATSDADARSSGTAIDATVVAGTVRTGPAATLCEASGGAARQRIAASSRRGDCFVMG